MRILGRPPGFLFKVDFFESNHPTGNEIKLLGPKKLNLEIVEDIVVMGKLARTSAMALACELN